ncbi:hypothetical protein CVIRNUC_010248 [Coccomyxa viridis]|uniref:Uncharacterized protein n=1 Tax=Coccomyxa viridis TaxID=1274662 RepID=A0AAV1ILE4_9CHLO|nr:hypothetical protein CVIRNUC_010248 [Coccomyxa viridis]
MRPLGAVAGPHGRGCLLATARAPMRAFSVPVRGRPIDVRHRVAASAAGAAPGTTQQGPSLEKRLGNLAIGAANLFPLWLVIGATSALAHPPSLAWFKREYITKGLALTMLSMGTTLTLEDFTEVVRRPQLVALGAALQYTLMPLMGYAVTRLFQLPVAYSVGICLVASCPGGVASNVVTFLARADVPLSVAMTTVSTLTAIVATPALAKLLVGKLVPVDAGSLLLSTMQVVLAPVAAGAWLNMSFPKVMKRLSPFAPLLAASMTILISASIVGQNAAAIRAAGPQLVLAVVCLHLGGFTLGYTVSRLAGLQERQARTNSIEVGMQNSALGAVLATLHFADPLTAIPCAISATTHSLLGSAFAGFWRMRDPGETGEEKILGVQEEERVVTVQTGGNSISDLQIRKAEAKAWIARWREEQQ